VKLPKYLPRVAEKHRIRISRRECEIVFLFCISKLAEIDAAILKYQKLYEKRERIRAIATKDNPDSFIKQSFDEETEQLEKLRALIHPKNIWSYCRLYDKLDKILKLKLNAAWIQTRVAIQDWLLYPDISVLKS